MPQTLSGPANPFRTSSEGLRLIVKLQPASRRNAILGRVEIADGQQALKIALTAPPVDGKANTALIAFIAKQFGLAKRSVEIERGLTDRVKRLHLRGDSEGLARQAKKLY